VSWFRRWCEQRSESSLSLGERLCAVFFPFVAIAEAIFFALTDCLADLCPGSDSSASRRYGAAASSSAATLFAAKNKSYHRRHHYRPMLRRDGWTSLDLRQLARLAADSRCCKNPVFPHPPLGWLARPPFSRNAVRSDALLRAFN
jgi:serine/threonine-protein phosphatase 2B regulatory subunit